MAKRRRTYRDALNDKRRILENADGVFVDAVQSTARSIWAKIKKIIDGISRSGGKFAPDETDRQTLLTVTRELTSVFADSTIGKKFDAFQRNFDRVEKLNHEYFDKRHGLDTRRINVSAEKRMIIENISNGLAANAGLRYNVVNPLREILFRYVTNGSNINEAEQYLRDWILGTNQNDGRILRYTKQLTMDALGQFDGTINQKILTEFDMPKFRYVNSIIKTTRQNCREMVQGSGKFADLKQDDGTYLVADIPKIIERSRNGAGWNKATTPETYLVYRGGYNCRHTLVPSL